MCYIKEVKSELSAWCRKNTILVYILSGLGLAGSIYIIVDWFTYNQYVILGAIALLCLIYEWNVILSKSVHSGFLRELPFLKSIILALAWVSITSILPISEDGFQWVHDIHCLLFILIRFLTCFLIVILFDFRDVSSDEKTGVRTIPVILGATVTAYIWYVIVLVIVLLLLFIEVHTYFVTIRFVQLIFLLFFLRTRNAITFEASMLLWDGVLIISPLTGLLFSL
ncbi:MAG: UbiA family prenyltransferase [Cytophagales bacterium]|nr:UbiA family prenyltransferase [Cytophaga sp.]